MPMVETVRLALVAGVAVTISLAGTAWLIRLLADWQIRDVPNERSSHAVPVPRGAGVAVLAAALIAWTAGSLVAGEDTVFHPLILGGAAFLALVGLVDDIRDLPAVPRLLAQVISVIPGLLLLQPGGGLFESVAVWYLDLALTGFVWLWFINLYNFMDGIDGITGVETVSLCIGIAGLAALGVAVPGLLDPALAVCAAALGFLVFNWHPARIFLGDVGSVSLGYLMGWLLIQIATGDAAFPGSWAVALILPGYYLADASITLTRRLVRGSNVLRAHREHFYQKALENGRSHATVCRCIMLANAALILVVWSLPLTGPEGGLAIAAAIIAAALLWMSAGHGSAGGRNVSPDR